VRDHAPAHHHKLACSGLTVRTDHRLKRSRRNIEVGRQDEVIRQLAEIEGFGIDPRETREMWTEALEHIVGIWTNEEYSFEGKHWQMPPRRVHPSPLQKPHPPIWGATSSVELSTPASLSTRSTESRWACATVSSVRMNVLADGRSALMRVPSVSIAPRPMAMS